MIGHYDLLEPLGNGATGTVWHGLDSRTHKACAVKLLRPELVADEGALARLRAVAEWVTELAHPGIIAIDEFVVDGDSVALISRLVPGESLRALLDRLGPLPLGPTLTLGAQLCDALNAARGVGVAHGDVKPSNILLEPESEPESGFTVRLTDFGMAVLVGRAATQQTAAQAPDAGYTAPEFGAGDTPTEAADVYSVGVVLLEALTGRVFSQRDEPGLPPLPDDVPETVSIALTACLAQDPKDRPSAATLSTLLREALASLGDGAEPTALVLVTHVPTAPTPTPTPTGAPDALDVPDAPEAADVADSESEEGHGVESPAVAAVAVADGGDAADAGAAAVADADADAGSSEPSSSSRSWVIAGATLCGVAVAAVMVFAFGPGFGSHGAAKTAAGTLHLPHLPVVSATTTVPAPSSTSARPSPSQTSASPTPSPSHRPSASPSAVATTKVATATAKAKPVNTGRPAGSPSAVSPSPAAPSPTSSNTGWLYNAASGACLNTDSAHYANGTKEEIWACNQAADQLWTYTIGGQLTQDGGAYCLDDTAWGTAPGTKAELWSCNGGANQEWSLNADGTIVSDYSGLCLEVGPPGDGNGTQIELAVCDGRPHQAWESG